VCILQFAYRIIWSLKTHMVGASKNVQTIRVHNRLFEPDWLMPVAEMLSPVPRRMKANTTCSNIKDDWTTCNQSINALNSSHHKASQSIIALDWN
jgi:hypothetical protein